MDNAIFRFPKPINEPVKAYAPGSSEKASLKNGTVESVGADKFRGMGYSSGNWRKRDPYG